MGDVPQGNGQLAQVLIELGKISTQVAVVSTKLDSVPVKDHEDRIRSLERFKWMLAGASLAGGAVAGGVVDLIMKALHG